MLVRMPRIIHPCPAVDLNNHDWIRLLTWVVCDGTMVDCRKYDSPTTPKRRVQFKLSRPEKIFALEELLNRMGIHYTKRMATMSGVNRLQPWCIRIYGNAGRSIFAALPIKQLPEIFLTFNNEQLGVLIEAILQTDGCLSRSGLHCNWTTTSLSDAEIVMELCNKHNIVVSMRHYDGASGFKKDCKRQYRVNIVLPESLIHYRIKT